MKRRTKFRIGILLTVAAMIGTVSVAVMLPAEPFSVRNRVLSSLAWKSPSAIRETPNEENYCWLNDETIVYALPDGYGKYTAIRQRVSTYSTFSAEPIPKVKPLDTPWLISISSSSKWLMALDMSTCFGPHYLFYELSETGRKREYVIIVQEPEWLPDGESFTGWEDYSRQWSRISLATGKRTACTSDENAVFTYDDNSINTPQPILERHSFGTGKKQIYIEPLGKTTGKTHLASVSPQHDKLLWYRIWNETPWWGRILNRFARQRIESSDYEEWFVTDTEGKRRRHVVQLATVSPRLTSIPKNSINLKWLPDGKHLSAVYKGALYVVPVPE